MKIMAVTVRPEDRVEFPDGYTVLAQEWNGHSWEVLVCSETEEPAP